ncbi:MAG TPA: hypothetical protein VF867_03120 [Arthrobacter sp.]
MLNRVRKALRGEAGSYMINTIIGSIVMTVVVGAIAAGILGLLLFQQAVTDRTDITKQVSLTDSTFRSDVLWASTINVTDNHTVEMTVPGQSSKCKVSTWTVNTSGAKTTVDVSVISYPGYDSSVNPVTCTGAPSAPSTQNFVSDAASSASFTFANAGGRDLQFTAGTAAVVDAPAPAGVTAKTWASVKPAAVALNVTVANSTDHRSSYRFAQTADNLSVVQDAADAPSHLVPEGDLTALP